MSELARMIVVVCSVACADAQPAKADAFVIGLRASPAVAEEMMLARDAWIGADKFRHFWTSYAVTAFAYAAARAIKLDADQALVSGVAVGAVAGIGKEVYDRRDGKIFSVRDLLADALGIGAAYALLRQVR